MVVLPALSRPKTRIRTSLLGLKEENNFEKMMPMLSGSGSCRNRGRKRKRLKNLVYRKTNKEKSEAKWRDSWLFENTCCFVGKNRGFSGVKETWIFWVCLEKNEKESGFGNLERELFFWKMDGICRYKRGNEYGVNMEDWCRLE